MEKYLQLVFWALIGVIYFLISYITGLWEITWIIFVIPLGLSIFLKIFHWFDNKK